MDTRRCAVSAPLILAILIPGCGSRPPDGAWAGKTSQGNTISLTTKGGSLTSLSLGWRMAMETPCRDTSRPGSPVNVNYRGGDNRTTFLKPYPLKGGRLSLEHSLHPDVDAKITGRFSGDAASGEIILKTARRSACKGQEKLTWRASLR